MVSDVRTMSGPLREQPQLGGGGIRAFPSEICSGIDVFQVLSPPHLEEPSHS